MDRGTKEHIVSELSDRLKDFHLAVLAGYSGMNVSKMTVLRNALRKSNTDLRVVKNTLLRIASEGTALRSLHDLFRGPLALILVQGDVVEATKILVDFAKKNPELDLQAGMMDGRFLDKSQLTVLAELPSREVLLGQLLSVMLAAQTALVTVLSGVPRSCVQVLEAYRVKMETSTDKG